MRLQISVMANNDQEYQKLKSDVDRLREEQRRRRDEDARLRGQVEAIYQTGINNPNSQFGKDYAAVAGTSQFQATCDSMRAKFGDMASENEIKVLSFVNVQEEKEKNAKK